MHKKGFFARLADLWRGFWGLKLKGAEARNAELVYHNAISQREHQYARLKDGVGRLVYLRNRVESSQRQCREDLGIVEAALQRAVATDDDSKALALIRKQRSLQAQLEHLQQEHTRLMAQADRAKESLHELVGAIAHLKSERDEMLARKQHAMARMEVASALQQTLGDTSSSDAALDNVREAIVRLETSAGLGEESVDGDGEVSLAALRRQAAEDADQEALSELKRRMGKHLLTQGSPTARDEYPGHDATEPVEVAQ